MFPIAVITSSCRSLICFSEATEPEHCTLRSRSCLAWPELFRRIGIGTRMLHIEIRKLELCEAHSTEMGVKCARNSFRSAFRFSQSTSPGLQGRGSKRQGGIKEGWFHVNATLSGTAD